MTLFGIAREGEQLIHVGVAGEGPHLPTASTAALVDATAFEAALAQTGFMNPLLCLGCFLGGGALLFRRTAPLGIALLAPLVVIIFCFHLFMTKSYLWGTLNLLWLAALAWRYRRGFDQLWHYTGPV